MSEKPNTEKIRFSQVLAGALAAITAAVLGSTMGVAGTVVGAGLASVVTTVGGALYLRSIQRTKQGVRSVRSLVVARAGTTSVTLVDERPAEPAPADEPETVQDDDAEPEPPAEQETGRLEVVEQEQPPTRRRLRWPALIAATVLAFVLGMLVVTGVEWIRGEPLSGGQGTTIGRIVRAPQGGDDHRNENPPATRESTPPSTGASTGAATPSAPTSENAAPGAGSSEPTAPDTTEPPTTTDAPPATSASVPAPGQPGQPGQPG
jgi:hypothetical protein